MKDWVYAKARWIAAACVVVLVVAGGWLIGGQFNGSNADAESADTGAAPVYRDIAGRIVEVRADTRTVKIDHEKIEGFMDAMVMDLKVAESVKLNEVSANQTVRFDLARIGDTYKIADIRSADPDTIESNAGAAAASQPANPLGPGDRVPDLTLYDTNGQRFQFREMTPKSKLITFFYVRCPLQNYCPAQSRKLAELQDKLEKSGSDVHLVSLTLDAEHDDAQVLADYAKRFDADPDRWTLAGGKDPEALRRFAHRAGGRVREYDDNVQIDHALVGLRVEGNRIVDRVYGLQSIAEMATGM